MATTNNKTTKENKVTKESIVVDVVDEEKELMKKEMEELKAQIALMSKFLTSQSNNVENNDNKYVTFINLTTGTIGLKGSVVYAIEGQFNKRDFLKSEAKLIVNNMPNLIHDGLVYIADADFVKECKLDYEYEHMLDDKELKNLLNQQPNYVVEIYKNASDGQKSIIESMIEDKRLNGVYVDANILVELSRITGKNYMEINPLTEE